MRARPPAGRGRSDAGSRLRIVSGAFRNRRITVPPGTIVRPTSERVREALFDILGPRIAGLAVLEVFAGSGALGFEALSRGARWVTFVEADRIVADAIRRNAAHLGVERQSTVVEGRAESTINGGVPGAPFDLVLADPPYDSPSGPGLVALIAAGGVLASGGRLIVERARRNEPGQDPASRLKLVRTARYGDTCLDFYADAGKSPGGLEAPAEPPDAT